ncbi:C-GCAxxG-C-C family protein [Pontiellaceae bacterium B12227]|nr:C-GCAxxG-C-C family protein [Pontiellaceae bacterium B12227]
MDRRKALFLTTGIAAGGGTVALTTAFKPHIQPAKKPGRISPSKPAGGWKYSNLNPAATAALAHKNYTEGSCMYAVYTSVISQLADKFGEPYTSFPCHMMKYGHGGVGGFGTLCGTLNGAAALIGLLVSDKKTQNALIADLFRWYEQTPLPEFKPENSESEIPTSVAGSTLCHASTTNWTQASDCGIGSKERKERCRRLSGDVASRLVTMLNDFFEGNYTAPGFDNETVRTCVTCHGKEGKLKTVSTDMNCTSCHSKSVGHQLFADLHYKCMQEKE